MSRVKSRAQRRAAFIEAAVQMYDGLEDWYDQHPDATFGQIEEEARRRRRELMGQVLAGLINGRDTGFRHEVPLCAKCGQPMDFEHYRTWTVRGLEGDAELSRAYYVCPRCSGETVFPPGSQTATACRPLE